LFRTTKGLNSSADVHSRKLYWRGGSAADLRQRLRALLRTNLVCVIGPSVASTITWSDVELRKDVVIFKAGVELVQ